MENIFDFEGGSVDYGRFTTSTNQKHELVTSLTYFVHLYGQHRDRLQRTSESFTLTAARLHETHQDVSENKVVQGLFSLFGGVLGAACGGVSGVACGAFGAVSAATCGRICGDINAVGATVGFVGSIFGGVAGGVFCGALGGAVGAAAKATGSPVHDVVRDVACFTIGFATGGAIGGIFGGTVGATGGAIGGAFGGLYATRFAAGLVGGLVDNFCRNKDSKEQKMKSKKVNMMQKTGDFRETIKPLVEELKTIKTISDKMASSAFVNSVAGQTTKTLASVTTMEEMISDSQSATDLPQFVSSVEEAARQCKKITEELEKTRAEVEKLLVSLRKH